MQIPVSDQAFKAASEEASRIVAQIALQANDCETCADRLPECHMITSVLRCSNYLLSK